MKVTACVVGLLIAGCVEAPPPESSQRGTYARMVQPILVAKCAASGCHGATSAAGALDVTTYDALSTRFDLLEQAPGKPYATLLTKAAGIDRHAGGVLLDVGSDAFLALQAWIENGATNE